MFLNLSFYRGILHLVIGGTKGASREWTFFLFICVLGEHAGAENLVGDVEGENLKGKKKSKFGNSRFLIKKYLGKNWFHENLYKSFKNSLLHYYPGVSHQSLQRSDSRALRERRVTVKTLVARKEEVTRLGVNNAERTKMKSVLNLLNKRSLYCYVHLIKWKC